MKFAIAALTAASAAATKFWTPHKVSSMSDWGMMSAPQKPGSQQDNYNSSNSPVKDHLTGSFGDSYGSSERKFSSSPSGFGGQHTSKMSGDSVNVSAFGGSEGVGGYGGS